MISVQRCFTVQSFLKIEKEHIMSNQLQPSANPIQREPQPNAACDAGPNLKFERPDTDTRGETAPNLANSSSGPFWLGWAHAQKTHTKTHISPYAHAQNSPLSLKTQPFRALQRGRCRRRAGAKSETRRTAAAAAVRWWNRRGTGPPPGR